MTEMQTKFQNERDRANKILDSMMVGDRYIMEFDSGWFGAEYYRGRDDSSFFFSKSKIGRKTKLDSTHFVSAEQAKE